MAQNKIQAIQDWLKPQKVQNIMSFLRFANFYHYFTYREGHGLADPGGVVGMGAQGYRWGSGNLDP